MGWPKYDISVVKFQWLFFSWTRLSNLCDCSEVGSAGLFVLDSQSRVNVMVQIVLIFIQVLLTYLAQKENISTFLLGPGVNITWNLRLLSRGQETCEGELVEKVQSLSHLDCKGEINDRPLKVENLAEFNAWRRPEPGDMQTSHASVQSSSPGCDWERAFLFFQHRTPCLT